MNSVDCVAFWLHKWLCLRWPSIVILSLLVSSPLTAQQPVATILSYHIIGTPDRATENDLRYAVSCDAFEAQLDYLQQNGYRVVPLSDLVDYIRGQLPSLPDKAVVITVDDGWLDSYTSLFPELQHRGMPFTLFIYPAVVGNAPAYVTWPEVRQMADAGVDIESHTFTHTSLPLRSHPGAGPADYDQFLHHELLDSKDEIAQQIGRPVRFLAYPYSDYDSEVERAASEYGYEAALYDRDAGELIERTTPLMHLKRFPVMRDTTLDQFSTFLLP